MSINPTQEQKERYMRSIAQRGGFLEGTFDISTRDLGSINRHFAVIEHGLPDDPKSLRAIGKAYAECNPNRKECLDANRLKVKEHVQDLMLASIRRYQESIATPFRQMVVLLTDGFDDMISDITSKGGDVTDIDQRLEALLQVAMQIMIVYSGAMSFVNWFTDAPVFKPIFDKLKEFESNMASDPDNNEASSQTPDTSRYQV